MLRLRHDTPPAWFEAVSGDLTAFLQDHAHNERKVSQSALVLATHYPTHAELVDAALEIADEELQHFRLLWGILKARGADLGYDMPDPYMKGMFAPMRKKHMDEYLLDRLIVYAIVEARGCERFALVARGLGEADPLGRTYLELEPPGRVVYTQQFVDELERPAPAPGAAHWPARLRTTVLLTEEAPQRTRVTVTSEPEGEATTAEVAAFLAERAGMTLGWTGSFDKLEARLDPDSPPSSPARGADATPEL